MAEAENTYYRAKRFEGKSLGFKFRYWKANSPETLFGAIVFTFVLPSIIAYRYYTGDDPRFHAMSKFKARYYVVRHDDPRVPAILAEKELGKDLFPKY